MIIFTSAAEKSLAEHLRNEPAGTRARISIYGTGCKCKPQHAEGRVALCRKFDNNDEFFEANGIPCVMNSDEYAASPKELRIGLAGIASPDGGKQS